MQSVTTPFATTASAASNRPAGSIWISWLRKQNSTTSFATVGDSLVDGFDIVQGEFTAITPADLFDYFEEHERLLSLKLTKELIEPLGGISYSYATINLLNHDNRFTPNFNSTIGTALLPKRPIKINLGYFVGVLRKVLPQFKGVSTSSPQQDKLRGTVTVKAFDFLSFLDEFKMETAIYTDKTTDYLIEQILISAGFNAAQYELDEGLNTVGFAWFEKGSMAGYEIRKLCEAEGGYFYQDENGKLIFRNRRAFIETEFLTTRHTIDKGDILDWQDDPSAPLYNRCTVLAEPREIQSSTEIYAHAFTEEIRQGETIEPWASFEDPVTEITTPAAITDYTANSASDGSGTDMTSDISIILNEVSAKTAKISITNNGSQKAYLTSLRLRGTAAVKIPEGGIEQIYQDDDSITKYGEVKELVVRNNYIDSESFAYYYARAVVRKYNENLKRVRVKIPAQPQLQLLDKVELNDAYTDDSTFYRILGIETELNGPSFTQWLTLREIGSNESDSPAIVGTALVDGNDVVWT